MINELQGREKVQLHLIANKLNEIIKLLNEQEAKIEEGEKNEPLTN